MKKNIKKLSALGLAMTLGLTGALADAKVERVAGKDKYETAVEISKKNFDDADSVILASGENFADALSGGQLALGLDAPILLSQKGSLRDDVKAELKRLDPDKIYILGGQASLGKKIEEEFDKDVKVIRLEGKDRYETSKAVMEETAKLGDYDKLVLVDGKDFPDALASANYLEKHDALLLLSKGDKVPETDLEIVAIGGENSLELKGFEGKRIAGKNRYETAMDVIKESYDDSDDAVLVSGETYADALAAVSFIGTKDMPLVLSAKSSLSPRAKAYLEKVDDLLIVGGENTLSQDLIKDLIKADDKDDDQDDQEEKTDSLVSVKEAKDLIGKEDVKVFDLRAAEKYEAGHIPGAINVSLDKLNDPDNPIAAELATKDQFEAAMRAYGVEEDDTILIYTSTSAPNQATRAFWALEAYGHDNKVILDGQFEAWEAGKEEIETGKGPEITASEYKVDDQKEKINSNFEDVLKVVKKEDQAVIIDCRLADAYKAKDPASDKNARGGHIPGAVNYFYKDLLNEDGTFKSKEEIKEIFKDAGLDDDVKIINYCQTGNTATVTWFALYEILGYENASLYDGSYIEWSNNSDLPVEFAE